MEDNNNQRPVDRRQMEEDIQKNDQENQFRNQSKWRFLIQMKEITTSKRNNTVNFTKEKYDKVLSIIQGAQGKEKKTREEYQYVRRYAVVTVNGCSRLVVPEKGVALENLPYYVHDSDVFDILYDVHVDCRHGGRDKMIAKMHSKYKNITREIISLFLKCCELCQSKAKTQRKEPTLPKELNSRAQVDLIDFQSKPDNGYKHIMVYQDHATKFCSLRALKTETVVEVATHVTSIFATFGAPAILHSDKGREFTDQLLADLCALWPGTKIVRGKPQHSLGQGPVERDNRCIEKTLLACMKADPNCGWTQLLNRVQYMRNSAHHRGIRMTPYEAMFGIPPKMGVTGLPKKLLDNISTEEEYLAVLDSVKVSEESSKIVVDNAPDEANAVEEGVQEKTSKTIEKRKIAKSGTEAQAKKLNR